YDMARSAAAGTVISRVVVRSQEIQGGVQQPRLLQADEHGIGAGLRPQAAIAQPRSGTTGFFETFGDARIDVEPPTALENPQDVTGMRNLKLGQRVEKRQDALPSGLLGSGGRHGLQSLRSAVHAVTFPVPRPFR